MVPVANSDGHRGWKYAPQVLLEIFFCWVLLCQGAHLSKLERIYENLRIHVLLIQVVPYIASPPPVGSPRPKGGSLQKEGQREAEGRRLARPSMAHPIFIILDLPMAI